MSVVLSIEENRAAPTSIGTPIVIEAGVVGTYPPPDYEFIYAFFLAIDADPDSFSVIQTFSLDRQCRFCTLYSGVNYIRCAVRLRPRRLLDPGDPTRPRAPAFIINDDPAGGNPFTPTVRADLFVTTLPFTMRYTGSQRPPCSVPQINSISPLYAVPAHNIEPLAMVRIIIKPSSEMASKAEQRKEQRKMALFAPPEVVPTPEVFSQTGFFEDPQQVNSATARNASVDFTRQLELVCNLKKGYEPPTKDIIITSWQEVKPGVVTYIPLFGLLANKTYEMRHQMLNRETQKRYELKEPVVYQTEGLGLKATMMGYTVNPLFAVDHKDRNFVLSLTGSEYFREHQRFSTLERFFIRPTSRATAEPAIYSAYGQIMVYISTRIQRAGRIIHCSRNSMYTLGNGICDWLYSGYIPAIALAAPGRGRGDDEDAGTGAGTGAGAGTTRHSTERSNDTTESRQESVDILTRVPESRKANKAYVKDTVERVSRNMLCSAESEPTFMGQCASACNINGAPQRTITTSAINYSLLQKAFDAGTSAGHEYRPLSMITHVQPLDSGHYIVSGLAEVLFSEDEYPQLHSRTSKLMSHIIANSSREYSSQDVKAATRVKGAPSSLLTAVVFLTDAHGAVHQSFYACDFFKTQVNSIQYVEMAVAPGEKTEQIPGFLSESRYALLHSYVNTVDVSQTDCLFCLPRQEAIVVLRYNAFPTPPPRCPRCESTGSLSKTSERGHLETPEAITEDVSLPTASKLRTYTVSTKDIPLSSCSGDFILYAHAKELSSLSEHMKQRIGFVSPLAVSRVSNRLYMLANTDSAVQLISISLPPFVGRGSKDIFDIMVESETTPSSPAPKELDDSKKAADEHGAATEITVCSRVSVESGNACAGRILALQKGGCAIAWKNESAPYWKVMEINGESLVYAGKVTSCEDLILLPGF